MILELREDVRDADQLENQQHDEDDADHCDHVAASWQFADALIELRELFGRQRRHARGRVGRIDTKCFELRADIVAGEELGRGVLRTRPVSRRRRIDRW